MAEKALVDDSDDYCSYSLWIAPHLYPGLGCGSIYLYSVLDIRYKISHFSFKIKKMVKEE